MVLAGRILQLRRAHDDMGRDLCLPAQRVRPLRKQLGVPGSPIVAGVGLTVKPSDLDTRNGHTAVVPVNDTYGVTMSSVYH